jgi:hypothetical protein
MLSTRVGWSITNVVMVTQILTVAIHTAARLLLRLVAQLAFPTVLAWVGCTAEIRGTIITGPVTLTFAPPFVFTPLLAARTSILAVSAFRACQNYPSVHAQKLTNHHRQCNKQRPHQQLMFHMRCVRHPIDVLQVADARSDRKLVAGIEINSWPQNSENWMR